MATQQMSAGGPINPEALAYIKHREQENSKLWRISQAVKLQNQNDLAGLQQFYDYVKGVVEDESD